MNNRSLILRRRGNVIILVLVLLTVMCGFCSLAVDYGRMQTAKTELQRAADAAARAGAAKLADGVSATETTIIAVAASNTVDGSAINLSSADIEFGTWNETNQTFTVLSGSARSSANALRVTTTRDDLPLYFASLIGQDSITIEARSIARRASVADPYPITGLSFVESESDAASRIDSYNSSTGPYNAATAKHNADVVSNGDIKLRNGATVYGDCHPGMGKKFKYNPTVTGSKSTLTKALNYPKASAGNVASANSNSSAAGYIDSSRNFLLKNSQTLTLPGGTYYFNKFQVLNSAKLTFSGPVTIFCTDRVDIDSTINTQSNIPKNFKLISLSNVTTPSDCEIEVQGNGNVYMDIYAPQCEVDVEDNAKYFGYVVGGSLEISESAFIHYDEASGTPNGSAGNSDLAIVQ